MHTVVAFGSKLNVEVLGFCMSTGEKRKKKKECSVVVVRDSAISMGNRQHRQEIIPIDSSDSNESRERLYGVFAGLVTVGLMLIGSKILEVFGTKPSERTQENKPPDQSIQSFELQFERIYCSLKTKKGLKVILDGTVHGHIRPGRMMAILGPSGAGKSAL